jgi:hypothetical protein
VGKLRELRRGGVTRRSGPNDQNIDLVRKVIGPVDAYASSRLETGITGHIAVVVELHRTLLAVLLLARRS